MKKQRRINMLVFAVLITVALIWPAAACARGPAFGRPPAESSSKNPITAFDADNDGRISREEFPGPSDDFIRFDHNNDGYLEENEFPRQPPRHGKNLQGRKQKPDIEAAAAVLDISAAALREALGDPRQGPPDFTAAAEKLGVTEVNLMKALQMRKAGSGGIGNRKGIRNPSGNGNTDAKHESNADHRDQWIGLPYAVIDTGQTACYDEEGSVIACPVDNAACCGQDAQYQGIPPAYIDNGDGTVTDLGTGLMWVKDPGEKMTVAEAIAAGESFHLAGYDDWRLPTIKELYSLILFSGVDPGGVKGNGASGLTPFIDDDIFDFRYGDPAAGERIIDSQWATCTQYVGTTMNNQPTMFGINFADGRIKGYPVEGKTYFALYVRGNPAYGVNDFVDNGDGTVTDRATGLMWMKYDSGYFNVGDAGDGALNWSQALAFAENLEYAGHSDWRLPNAKELQSIVDYSRSPATTGTAAIDPVFQVTPITDEGGHVNYPFYWTSTTHAGEHNGEAGVYVAFGEALGWMQSSFGGYTLMDVHGAGAQRSDPKIGDPEDFPFGRGPQGDVIRIYNYVRCVRDISSFP